MPVPQPDDPSTSTDHCQSTSTPFSTPTVYDHPNGWGPSTLPSTLSEIPYAPYSKSDRLGRAADWTNPAEDYHYFYDRETGQRNYRRNDPGGGPIPGGRDDKFSGSNRRPAANYRGAQGIESFGAGTASAFEYRVAAEEEGAFSLVDRASTTKPRTGFKPSRGRGGAGGRFGAANRGGNSAFDNGGRFAGRGAMGGGWRGRRFGYQDKPQRVRDASVKIGAEWKVLQEIDFNGLAKLFFEVEDPQDIETYGEVNYYDKTFDKKSTKNTQALKSFDRFSPNLTTSFDPILQKLSKDVDGPTVFATDNVLSTLMCATRAVYSWDIVIQKDGDKLFLDKRDGSQFDFLSVNENAAEAPLESTDKENPNTPQQLSIESTYVNKNFSQQVLNQNEKFTLPNENPFVESSTPEQPASAIYRYRKWDLGDDGSDLSLIARTQIDGALHMPGINHHTSIQPSSSAHLSSETLLVNIKTLNEFDSKAAGSGGAPDWRQKLDSQRGAVMATEIKNNGNKLARWTVESVLSGADQIKIGFVSRVSPKDRSRHVILGTAYFKPRELASQMNLNIGNAFGVLKVISDLCMKLEDGKYVLVKDPNKSLLRLYSVPSDTFEEDEASDEDDVPARDDGNMDE
ncbi:hypothetical protein SeMB42_g01546 [Synchytrium endobioticum]|uniref:Eukaryotic translation initiation factor 3 subunit D n=1 Tax=Synchytrium endobioticum TaxID=286115 RepID=A0A507DN11_9FUNG|nr:hypothetical protein SeLEV6574_g06779 [Synchytrium endobioticum]TPX52268.1 hypothetical protein SeMB42_g01546 [Synchytrium endobioticum]